MTDLEKIRQRVVCMIWMRACGLYMCGYTPFAILRYCLLVKKGILLPMSELAKFNEVYSNLRLHAPQCFDLDFEIDAAPSSTAVE